MFIIRPPAVIVASNNLRDVKCLCDGNLWKGHENSLLWVTFHVLSIAVALSEGTIHVCHTIQTLATHILALSLIFHTLIIYSIQRPYTKYWFPAIR